MKTSKMALMRNRFGLVLLRTQIGRMGWLPVLFLLTTAAAVKAFDFAYTTNSDNTITITRYNGFNDTVAIPSTIDGKTVVSIGSKVFSSSASLTAITVNAGNAVYSSVDGVLFNKSKTTLIQCPGGKAGSYTIPSTVTSIGDEAFKYCTSLTNVSIPNSVVSIGAGAFKNCASLAGVTIGNSVIGIGADAFRQCTRLIAITVDTGNAVYSSGDGVLFNKSKTTLIQCPGGKAGGYAIPSSVTSIGADAFFACTSLTSVTIPDSVANIGDCAFNDCASLTAITVGARNAVYSSVDGVLFNNSKTMLIQYPGGKTGNYTIPSSVASIGAGAFYFCTSLAGVSIPNTVTNIGSEAFYSCTSLTSVTIPDSVISIGAGAFKNCTSLAGVTIGNSVTGIGDDAFWGCTSLTSITVGVYNAVYSSGDGVLFNKSKTTLVQCPGGQAGSYTIPSTVTSIGDRAFSSCTGLTGVVIPSGVTSIGSEAFYSCTSLTSITIPHGVTSIGDLAFFGCTSLASITMDAGNAVYSSVDGVLFNKSKTTLIRCPGGKAGSYTVPNGVTGIWDSAFSFCTSLTSVSIPDSVTGIGSEAFYSCTSLASITIPRGVTSIGDLAFFGCTSLAAITVSALNSIYSSGDGVLFNKSKTTLVQCPGGKTAGYTIPNGVTSIGDSAFYSCTSLTSVSIPDSVTGIGDCTFPDCTSLGNVTIPGSVTNIENYAFYDCVSLKGVYFKGNAPSIGSSVFDGDNKATVYYLAGATGWGATFGGRPAVLWNAIEPPISGRPAAQDNAFGPKIKANGSEGEVTIDYPGAVFVTVEMDAGDFVGIPVDWWVVVNTGSSWFYLDSAAGWKQEGPWRPVYQGGLFNMPATEVLNMTGLAVGLYTFYFAVDCPMDGILNLDIILVDTVNVIVQ
ncbi:MAG: leucine-rich repeat domain-containing protein [Verrucomicrobia bacterium]|nr:leucine-rich repeat domain-containing protein [Verrucomicrobiota bacterium]